MYPIELPHNNETFFDLPTNEKTAVLSQMTTECSINLQGMDAHEGLKEQLKTWHKVTAHWQSTMKVSFVSFLAPG